MTVGANQLIQYTERMVGENHATYDDTLNRAFVIDHEQDGHHQWCHLHENSQQTTGADEGLLFVQNDGTRTELYFRGESDATAHQITENGALYLDNNSGIILADGTNALTANWDAGSYEIRAQTFESDVATGTSPFTIASTTVVSNLNVDQVDGKDSTDFVLCDGTQALTANWDAGSYKITAEQLESDIAIGTAPLIVTSTTVVSNLNADQVDGKDSTDLILADGSQALTANWDVGSYKITAQQLESDVATGTAPLVIASTTAVSNLNSDQVDGKDSTDLVLVDGSQALTANWDAGSYKITAETLESDVTTGTAPLTIASTTVVNNLNVDQVDGKDEGDFLLTDGTRALSGGWSPGQDINMADNVIQRPEIKDYSETIGTITGDSTPTIDFETANVWDVTITNAETTFTFSNAPTTGKAGSATIIIRQNATAQTLNFPAGCIWSDGDEPAFSDNSGVYVMSVLTVDGTDSVPVYFCFLAGDNMS